MFLEACTGLAAASRHSLSHCYREKHPRVAIVEGTINFRPLPTGDQNNTSLVEDFPMGCMNSRGAGTVQVDPPIGENFDLPPSPFPNRIQSRGILRQQYPPPSRPPYQNSVQYRWTNSGNATKHKRLPSCVLVHASDAPQSPSARSPSRAEGQAVLFGGCLPYARLPSTKEVQTIII